VEKKVPGLSHQKIATTIGAWCVFGGVKGAFVPVIENILATSQADSTELVGANHRLHGYLL